MTEDGTFVKGAFVPTYRPEMQRVEIIHRRSPMESSISLNGKPLRCISYTVHQSSRGLGTIGITIPMDSIIISADVPEVIINGDKYIKVTP